MPKISVIIPVYNVEKYLSECLDSIINQTFKDIEIICIDDGSTDNSHLILEEYVKKDSRIKIVEQKNQGAGASRNKGIECATGEYLHFMDSDDALYQDAYSKIFEILENNNFPNVIRFAGRAFDERKQCYITKKIYEQKSIPQERVNTLFDINNDINLVHKITVVPWLGFIRRDFVLNNNLRFNKLKVCNDRSFFIESLLLSEKFYITNILAVKHRVNVPNSLKDIRHIHYHCMFDSINIIKDFCKTNNIVPNTYKIIMLYEFRDVFKCYNQFTEKHKMSYSFFKDIISFCKEIDVEKYTPEIKSIYYYPTFCELKSIKENWILFNYIKKFFFNCCIIFSHKHYILLNCIKISIRRKKK